MEKSLNICHDMYIVSPPCCHSHSYSLQTTTVCSSHLAFNDDKNELINIIFFYIIACNIINFSSPHTPSAYSTATHLFLCALYLNKSSWCFLLVYDVCIKNLIWYSQKENLIDSKVRRSRLLFRSIL